VKIIYGLSARMYVEYHYSVTFNDSVASVTLITVLLCIVAQFFYRIFTQRQRNDSDILLLSYRISYQEVVCTSCRFIVRQGIIYRESINDERWSTTVWFICRSHNNSLELDMLESC